MSAYVKHLKELVALEAGVREAQQAAVKNDSRRDLSPLDDRLQRLLATIPTERQVEGLSLTTLQTALRGRWRGNCHPGDLGRALRRLGYTRRREWSGGEGFRALWFPPG